MLHKLEYTTEKVWFTKTMYKLVHKQNPCTHSIQYMTKQYDNSEH